LTRDLKGVLDFTAIGAQNEAQLPRGIEYGLEVAAAPNERPTELDVSLLVKANEIESRSSNLLLNPSPGDLGAPSNVMEAGFRGTCA
jgi:hypothetical protein